ncbi:MAG TPA: hypothetical protein PLU22_03295 [Polyangiaceae bacterium]|nr:hypothetical protein [Polyangiaceae bacterium]
MTLPRRAGACALLLTATACFPPGEGRDPPLERVYFPVGLALDDARTRLFVVSSDFDLQYNGGAVHAFDLERLRGRVPQVCAGDADCPSSQRCDDVETAQNGGIPSFWCVDREGPRAGAPCGALRERSAANRWLEPGRCEYLSAVSPQDGGEPIQVDAVGIGAFATDVLYRAAPPDAAGGDLTGRLFVPVRGDATLHVIDIRAGDGRLWCGQDRNEGKCADAYRAGDDPETENTRDLRMPPEPFAIDATADGEAIAVTHQTDGSVSLFVNDWERPARLEFVAAGLPQRVVGIAAIPEPAVVAATGYDYRPGFLTTFRDSPEVRLLRFYDDIDPTSPSSVRRPFLEQSGGVVITANATGYDSRGIAIDAGPRRACEVACAGEPACLGECAGIPLGVFVSNRSPDSLLVGATRPDATPTSSDDLPIFYDSVPVPVGASRVVVGQVVDAAGRLASRVFVLCFDQRRLVIYDPVARRIEKTVTTGRGPHAFVVDATDAADGGGPTSRSFGYLAHFTDSYLAVVDLDQRHHRTYGEIVLTIGNPVPPRANK